MREYNTKHSVDESMFINPTTREAAYILGLIWSDGYVYQRKYSNVVSVFMIEEDIKSLIPFFQQTGKWNIVKRIRKGKKPSLTISTNNKPLTNFLLEKDYKSKTFFSADKILSIIPDNLKHYWFRGLLDGDGMIYVNQKNMCYQLSIASSYNQDWNYCEKTLKKMKIKYGISKRIQKTKEGKINKSSIIRISNKKGIIEFGKFLYPNLKFDEMGLKRKFDKLVKINDVHHQTI